MHRELGIGLVLLALVGTVFVLAWDPDSAPSTSNDALPRQGILGAPPETGGAAGEARASESVSAAGNPAREQAVAEAQASEVEVPVGTEVCGRVLLPDGTPPDERAEVVLECAVPWASGQAPQYPAWTSEWPEAGRCSVEADGSFSLVIPRGADRARLRLEGRYVWSRYAEGIEDLADPTPVLFEPILGTNVTFVLVPPEEPAHDPAQLVGRMIVLSHTSREFSWIGPPARTAFEIRGDLTFGGVALSPRDSYSIDCDPSFGAGPR